MVASRRCFLKWSLASSVGAVGGFFSRSGLAETKTTLAVVVSQSSPLKEISSFDLKRLYLGAHINDPHGNKLIPLNQPPRSTSRVAFDASVLGMTPKEIARYWIEQKIRGKGEPPKIVNGPDLLQRVVSQLERAIGYVSVEHLRDDVRVVLVDGKRPGDSGYRVVA